MGSPGPSLTRHGRTVKFVEAMPQTPLVEPDEKALRASVAESCDAVRNLIFGYDDMPYFTSGIIPTVYFSSAAFPVH